MPSDARPEPRALGADAPDVSVLIVLYRAEGLLDACLDALEASAADLVVEIIAVDNASPDRSVERARARGIPLVEMGYNSGFSVANNAGLRRARGRHVLLLNADCRLRPGILPVLVGFLDATPDAGVVAPRLRYPDGTDQRTARRFPTPAAALFGRRSPVTRLFPNNPWSRRFIPPDAGTATAPFEIDWVSGACLMAPRTLLDELGGLDEGFFMHFEDADLCARVKRRGRSVWCVPEVEAEHDEGASRGGWTPTQIRHFHHGAYRFYARQRLTGPWRVLRPVAAALLALRAGLLTAQRGWRRQQ